MEVPDCMKDSGVSRKFAMLELTATLNADIFAFVVSGAYWLLAGIGV